MPAGYGTPAATAEPMKDLASAIEEAPAEVEMAEESETDPEQAGLIEEMGLSPEQGQALIRLIETMI